MGRKKRKVGEHNGNITPPNVPGGHIQSLNANGANYGGIPPPPPPPQQHPGEAEGDRIDTYICKKYRYDQASFRYIKEFVEYVKAHRMGDSTFQRHVGHGVQGHKKELWTTVIAGSTIGYGRASSRDKAIENACRASFHVLRSPGWTDIALGELRTPRGRGEGAVRRRTGEERRAKMNAPKG
jgi:hypothetical protein